MVVSNKSIKKVITMYGSSFLGVILGFAISVFNTDVLGKEAFGDFKFIQTVFKFLASIVSVGIFISITRMLALANDKEYKRKLIGFFILSLVVASLIGVILLIIFSYLQPVFFENDLGIIFRKYSLLIFAVLGNIALLGVLKGLDKIYTLAILNSTPGALYLLIAYLYEKSFPVQVENLLVLMYCIQLLYMLIIVYRLKPKFNISKSLFKAVIEENNRNGKPIYYGSLAGAATTQIAGFTIAYYLNNTQVGFYTLAITVCTPLLIIPSVLGTTFFKKFTSLQYIPNKVFIFSLIATAFALLVFYLFVEKVFLLFYSADFIPAVKIAKFLIFGFIFYGLGDLINRYLGAKGKGKLLRNAAFVVGIVNVLGYFLLVKYFGVTGAIITRLTAGLTYLSMMYYYYKNYIKRNNHV